VSPAHLLAITKDIEKHAPTMAALMSQCIGSVFRYAMATLRAASDPSQVLRGSLKQRETAHHNAFSRADLAEFLVKTEASGSAETANRIGLRLALLTLVRSTEIIGAKWDEIDIDGALWRIPSARMKMRQPHTVPLSDQALRLLTSLRINKQGEFLFPNKRNPGRPASKGLFWKAMAGMGYTKSFSPHGIRATGSTHLNEMGFRNEVIERQLAHKERNKTRASYNHAEYLDERRAMMQTWADYLDSLKAGRNVTPIRKMPIRKML